MNSRQLGTLGENQAAQWLEARGCRIIMRNYRTRFGEIDLVVQEGRHLIFVEVKSRGMGSIARPKEAITAAKKARLQATAESYLQEHPTQLQPRFDVIEVFFRPSGNQLIRLENVFPWQ